MATEFCTYHPLAPATYCCKNCGTNNCDLCTDEGDHGVDSNCFSCEQSMESLGAVNQAVPFWRRLEESFRYPMNANAIILIVGVAVLTSVLLYIPFGFVLSLMLTGAFIKYCFASLNNTADGLLVPPDISEAYGGGLTILLRLLAIFIAIGAATFTLFRFLGPEFAGFFLFLSVLALPAIIILFAMSDSLGEALNPLNVLRLIASIGLPYGLLLAFIMIMSASVSVINALWADSFSLLSVILQSTVSNYYTLVVFHIMGYMIFQYQGSLGFTAREDRGEETTSRSPSERLAAKIDVRLKEGDYNGVVDLLQQALKKFRNDRDFNKQYFEFIFASERLQALESTATDYLNFLVRSDQEHQLSMIYKRVQHLLPNFVPNSAVVRHKLAAARHDGGDFISAVKLLNGLHKSFPDYEQLPEAMTLMADALGHLPNKQEAAAKCRELAKRLAERRPPPTAASKPKPRIKPTARAKFNIGDDPKAAMAQDRNSLTLVNKEEPANDPIDQQDGNKDLPPIEFK